MPRDGLQQYAPPPGTNGITNYTIESTKYNGFVADITADLNNPRPIVAGGTGANNANQAMLNLGGEIAKQAVTNYDSFPFAAGSFYSLPGATSAPDAGHYYVGICYMDGTGALITLEARQVTGSPTVIGPNYVRTKDNTGWSAWAQQSGSVADLDATYVNVVGDTMTGNLSISKTGPTLTLNKPDNTLIAIYGTTQSKTRWRVDLATGETESGGQAGSNFQINRFDDAGTYLGTPFGINRATGNATFSQNVTAGAAGTTGTYYFGNSGTKALSCDGTNYTLAAGAFIVNGNVYSMPTATTGVYFFGNSGNRYLQYDGSSYTLAGAALAVNGITVTGGFVLLSNTNNAIASDGTNVLARTSGAFYVQNTSGSASYAIIQNGNASFNGQVSAVSASFTGAGGVFCQRSDNSYQYRLADTVSSRTYGLAILANGYFTLDDISGGASRLQINTNGQIAAQVGYQCKAGAAGAFGGNAFNLMYNAGSTALWIDNTNFGNINVTSDYRIKKDVIDLPGMWDTVKGLRPIKYTQAEFSTPSHRELQAKNKASDPTYVGEPQFPADDIERWGFIAHELQETLLPSAVSGEKDSPDTIQSPNPFPVIAALTKALQEAMTRIEALEQKAAPVGQPVTR